MGINILVLTQKIDINDDLLGFMHGWIFEFAKYCEKVTVICLRKGEYELPSNVRILSLGKEKKITNYKLQITNKIQSASWRTKSKIFQKLIYVIKFYRYIWVERKNYDNVFVHMNKEYVLLGGLLWRLWNKKIMLWYNHRYGNLFAVMAAKLTDVIFYASPFSFMARYGKARQMPAGIDTNKFNPPAGGQSSPSKAGQSRAENFKADNPILCLGRISPVKNIDILIKAVKLLDEKGVEFVLNIIGEPGENDKDYFLKIQEMAKELEEKRKIKFWGSVPNEKTPEIYNQNEIFINLTNSGSLDKTTLEAMSCGTTAIVCNESYKNIFPTEWHSLLIFKENDEADLAEKIINFLNLSDNEKEEIGRKSREIVIEKHSLKKLINNLINLINPC